MTQVAEELARLAKARTMPTSPTAVMVEIRREEMAAGEAVRLARGGEAEYLPDPMDAVEVYRFAVRVLCDVASSKHATKAYAAKCLAELTRDKAHALIVNERPDGLPWGSGQ